MDRVIDIIVNSGQEIAYCTYERERSCVGLDYYIYIVYCHVIRSPNTLCGMPYEGTVISNPSSTCLEIFFGIASGIFVCLATHILRNIQGVPSKIAFVSARQLLSLFGGSLSSPLNVSCPAL